MRTGGEGACWPWLGSRAAVKRRNYYGSPRRFHGRKMYIHQIMWTQANRRFPKQWILHNCGNSACCNPAHLREGNAQENAIDRSRHGTGRRSLSVEQVRVIKDLLREQCSPLMMQSLARVTGVSYRCVELIATNKTWTWLTE
jgi:hypothetical protein